MASVAAKKLAEKRGIGGKAIEVEREAVEGIKVLAPDQRDLTTDEWADAGNRSTSLPYVEISPVWLRAISPNLHSALTSRICSIEVAWMSSKRGLQTRTARHRAREIATLRRLRLKRNSTLRGISSPLEVAIEKKA